MMKTIEAFKLLTIFTILVTITTGCVENELHAPSVKNMRDATLKVNNDGDVSLKKSYTYKDGTKSSATEEVSTNSKKKETKEYEVVPDFEQENLKNITIKEEKNRLKDKIKVYGNKVKISVEEIPVNEFIDLVFGQVLKLNYTTSKEINTMDNPITLNMSEEQSKQEVFEVISKLLSFEGIQIKKEDGVLFISQKAGADGKTSIAGIHVGYGYKVSRNISDDETIIQLLPYRYISPREAIKFIDFAGISTKYVSYVFFGKNFGMLKGKASDVKKAIKIVRLVDRPSLEKKKTYLVNLQNIDVEIFTKRVTDILETNGVQVGEGPQDLGIVLSPIVELNSLLVISPKQNWIDMVLYWKKKLDIESETTKEPKFYTYKVKNRKADELAEAINSVITIKLSTNKKIQKKSIKSTATNNNANSNTSNNANKQIIPKQTISSSKKTSQSVMFDLPTNTLMMQLLPSEYRQLLPLIEELDALPLQVLVEVTLAEVTLTDSFALGFEYTLTNSGTNSLASAAIGAAFGGSGFAGTYNSSKLDATINALAENKLLSIMSKPKILILNNETGSINVGSQIPIVSSETSANDIGGTQPSILRNISYQSTGVIVGLTPTINSNGILTMNVNLTLSEAQLNDTSSIDSPLIVNRTLSTALILKDGETVLLGGLISKNKSSSEGGVPFLKDVPWIGTLFKTQSEKIVKTELIMLIKPFIIHNPEQMTKSTNKYKSMLKTLSQYSLF